ncbi:uncharacterized protein LOC134670256 isoform X2 [Cydia fagiglandana]|uniref:uncharacterized protein LOC134670256 isoform X2 n=1 Tax=Cydia fagiglandana TaxID=1458189 RepID=UPI002FEE2DF0
MNNPKKLNLMIIRFYRDQKCLWDPSEPHYRHVARRHEAYIKISEQLFNIGIPMAVTQIQKKIKALRDSYYNTRKSLKKERSIRPRNISKKTKKALKLRLKCFHKLDKFLKNVSARRRKPVMMSTCNDTPTMENSTIVGELAEFDIKAPISVTISFDDDLDEPVVKKQIVSDDYQEEETQETVISTFFPILETKPEIQAETPSPCLSSEKQCNDFIVQNVQDAPQPDNLYDGLLNSNTSRKRKTENLEMCKPKQFKILDDKSDDNNCDKENSHTTHTKSDNIQSDPNITIREPEKHSTVATTLVGSSLSNKKATDKQFDLSSYINEICPSEKEKIRLFITGCLDSLSDNMICIMQAFVTYRQQHISKEEFKKKKQQYFNSAYKMLVKVMLPEEKNKDFIHTFLNNTLQRGRKKCGPYFMPTYQDYANLFHEMLMWAKMSQQPIRSAIKSVASVGSEFNKNPAQDKLQSTNTHKNTAAEKVCIFSSGPPERALSINIDPTFQKYLHNTSQYGSNETNTESNNTTQLQTAVACLTRFVANSSQSSTIPSQPNPRPPVIQPTASVSCNRPTAQQEQHPAVSSNSHQGHTTSNISNYSILTHQKTATPLLQKQLEKPPLLGYLQQVDHQPPSYDSHFQTHLKQVQQAKLPYDQSQRLRAQSIQQQQLPSQYNPAQYQQSQYLQSQSGIEYNQTWQLGQSPLPTSAYNQSRQAQVGLLQQDQYQQQQQHPADSWPTMEELLSMDSTQQLPYQSSTEQVNSFGQWQSRQQAQPPQASTTEWHQQGQVYQGQVPSQTQKGSPRSASTDSGFISPLNFNVPTDQTRQDSMVIDLCNWYGITYADADSIS